MLTLIARFLPGLLPGATVLFNPWMLLVLGLLLAGVWFKGYQTGAGKLEAYRSEQFTAATKINTKRVAVTVKVQTRYIEKAGQTRAVTENIEKEVVDYAQQNPAGLCLDADWRRVHDRAALNAVSDPTGRSHAALRTPGDVAEGFGSTISR